MEWKLAMAVIIRRIFLISLLFLSFQCYATELIAVGPGPAHMTLSKVVEVSAIVARIQITSSSPVLNDALPDKPVCGVLYEATVLQSLKGSRGKFKFFTPSENKLLFPGKIYLAFVRHRTTEESSAVYSSLSEVLSAPESYAIKCKLESGFYVPTNDAFVIPFDAEAERQFGGQWLASKSGILFCKDGVGTDTEDDRFSRKNRSGQMVLSWPEVVRLIEQSNSIMRFFRKNWLDPCVR